MSVDRPTNVFDLPVSMIPEAPVDETAVQEEEVCDGYASETVSQLEFSNDEQPFIVNPLFADDAQGPSEEEYEELLLYVIQSSKKESADVSTAILEAIFSVGSINSDLFNRLLIDSCTAYNISPLGIWTDTLEYLRFYLKSDEEFVRWSLKLVEAADISSEHALYHIFHHLSDEALLKPEVVVPLFKQIGFDSEDPRHTEAARNLRDNHPDLFNEVLLQSPEFFKAACEILMGSITREIAIEAVKKNASWYQWLPYNIRDDEELTGIAVVSDGMMLEHIPESLITDELITTAITQNPHAVKFIKSYSRRLNSLLQLPFTIFEAGSAFLVHKSDYIYVTNAKDYYEMALQIDGMAIGELSQDLRTPELMEIAKNQNPRAVIYTPNYFFENLTEHKEYILDILKEDPSFYRNIPLASPLRSDYEVMKLGLGDPQNIPLILGHEDVSRGIVLMAVAQDGLNIKYVSNAEFRQDPEIVWAALSENAAAINYVHPSQRYRSVWHYLLEDDPRTSHLTRIPHRNITDGRIWSLEDYAKMMADRAEIETMLKGNPSGIQHPSEPVALFIMPIADHNGAFKWNSVHRMMNEGYKVAYYEVANEDEFISVMNHYLPMLKEGDSVFLGGHGTAHSLALSKEGDYGELNTSDHSKLADAISEEDINKGVTLVLASCSNGEGGTEKYNMMMMMYEDVFGKKWHVYAMDRPDGGYPVIKDGELVTPGTLKSHVYHVSPDGEVEVYKPLQNIISVAYYFAYDFIDAKIDLLTSDEDILAGL